MVLNYSNADIAIQLNCTGATTYTKTSYPVFHGRFTIVETADYIFHFNLNGEIIRVKGKGQAWPHPHEWLKRTVGNDWVYVSTGGYTGVYESTGEYYLPNFPYPTNSLLGGHPFADPGVQDLLASWYELLHQCAALAAMAPPAVKTFFASALANSPAVLAAKAERLFTLCDGRPTVLPPDARHVDYQLIPLTVAKGCLYKCQFCQVKNDRPFVVKSAAAISTQIAGLADLYGPDLVNYNALFLGDHDALQAGAASLLASLDAANRQFSLAESAIRGCNAFSFGSVTSLLNCPETFFVELEKGPYTSFINIGLESADQETLNALGKPITAALVRQTFARIQDINDRYNSVEITANFVFDDDLPKGHYPALLALIRESLSRNKPKGCVYMSPLQFDQPARAKLFAFNRLKLASRVPLFLYIIQRL